MISVVPSTSYRQAFESLELARFKLLTNRLLTFASTPEKDDTKIHDFDVTIKDNEAMLTAMHVPKASVMCFGVRATAAAAPSRSTNAMAALMHHGRAAYARTAMISSDEVAGWFTGGNAKGQLAQRTCRFLGRPLHSRRRNNRLTVHSQFHLILNRTPPARSTCAVLSTARRPPHTAATHPAWCPFITCLHPYEQC